MTWAQVTAAIITAFVGGGGLATLLRIRPDASKVIVDAAQGAVIVQANVIDRLQRDIADCVADRDKLRRELAVVERRIDALEGGAPA